MLEVIDGLKSAGVKTRDIVVFERYRDEFIGAKMDKDVPDGIAWTGLGIGYNTSQIDIKGDDGKTGNLDRVAGYDPDEFMVMELVGAGLDPKDERTRRSHLGLLITRRVNKIVLLPVLKDHGSAGVTGALKNMSHGLVNNVNRSHSTPDTNVCNQFIPQVVNHPIIKKKCVLHIMDGIKGVFQGGPAASRPDWTWENNALFFATDPVAMDHVAWRYVDAKRKEKNLPLVAFAGRDGQDPLGARASTFASPSIFRWPPIWVSACSTSTRRRGGSTRSSTTSSTWPDDLRLIVCSFNLFRAGHAFKRLQRATAPLPRGQFLGARLARGGHANGQVVAVELVDAENGRTAMGTAIGNDVDRFRVLGRVELDGCAGEALAVAVPCDVIVGHGPSN